MTREQRKQIEQEKEQRKKERRCLLIRMVIAAMLFLFLSIAAYKDISFRGITKDSLRYSLENRETWNKMVSHVAAQIDKIKE